MPSKAWILTFLLPDASVSSILISTLTVSPGVNAGIGSDDTVYAKVSGYVKYERLGKDRKQVSVYESL